MEQEIKRAEQLYQDHRYKEALDVYEEAIRQSASKPDPRLYYGQAATLERLAQQAHKTAYELGYTEDQEVNVTMDQPLGEMSLTKLAEHCAQEVNKYQRHEPSDERYGLEIFRRAMTLGDHEAWATLQRQFTEIVRFWFAHHTYREVALRYENEQDYIDHAFQRLWQTTVGGQASTFNSLAGALHYLRLCLHCAIMDTLRVYANAHQETLPDQEDIDEPEIEHHYLVEDHYNENEMWEVIRNLLTNERERHVAYLYFHANLKPREIMRYCPGEFSSEEEIYRLKRNIMERIMRNIDKIRWRLGHALS